MLTSPIREMMRNWTELRMFVPHAIRINPDAVIPAARFCIQPIGLGARMLVDLRALGGLGPGGPLTKGVWTQTETVDDDTSHLIEACGYGGSDIMLKKHGRLTASLGLPKPVTVRHSALVDEFNCTELNQFHLRELCRVNDEVVQVTDWPGNGIKFPADEPVQRTPLPRSPVNAILFIRGSPVSRVSLRSDTTQDVIDRHVESELADQLKDLSSLSDPTRIWFTMMGLRAGSGSRFGWTIRQDLIKKVVE